jgi:hypothetical protein
MAEEFWLVVELKGCVSEIRLIQSNTNVLPNPKERALARFIHYSRQHTQEHHSFYYGCELTNGRTAMIECDADREIDPNIAVRKDCSSSLIIDEILQPGMLLVFQILDMDHTFSNYLTVRCLTDGIGSDKDTKLVDGSFGCLRVGDELGIRVRPNGKLTFSCNNRTVKHLLHVGPVQNRRMLQEKPRLTLEMLMNGRVTALRLIGLFQPDEYESDLQTRSISHTCRSAVRRPICYNAANMLLLPCRHLCVCLECSQVMKKQNTCPNIKCRKPIDQCIRVFRG